MKVGTRPLTQGDWPKMVAIQRWKEAETNPFGFQIRDQDPEH